MCKSRLGNEETTVLGWSRYSLAFKVWGKHSLRLTALPYQTEEWEMSMSCLKPSEWSLTKAHWGNGEGLEKWDITNNFAGFPFKITIIVIVDQIIHLLFRSHLVTEFYKSLLFLRRPYFLCTRPTHGGWYTGWGRMLSSSQPRLHGPDFVTYICMCVCVWYDLRQW